MSTPEALKASLKSHNASFDSLLRVIPAKYYLRPDSDEEEEIVKPTGPLTKKQKKALRKAKQDEALRAAKNEAARKARLARYDPDEPKTIAEIQAAKAAGKGKGPASSDEEDSSDDEQDWQDISQSGTMEVEGGEEDEEEDSPNESDFADSDQEIEGEELMELNEEGVLAKAKKDGPAPTITELREKLQKRIADIQAKKKEAAGAGGGATKRKAQPSKGADADDEDEEEDDDGTASVKSKDDLLEERKRRAALRDNRRKKRKEQKKNEKSDGSKKRAIEPSNGRAGGGKVNAPVRGAEAERPRKKVRADSPSYDAGSSLVPYSKQADQTADASGVAFSNLDFTSQSQKVQDAALTPQARKQMMKAAGVDKKNRHDLPKDANAALEILEKRKQRMEELNPEKREKAEEKDRWEKVLLKAEGEKVRDDPTRLKKMAKRQEREKKKSAKAWTDRKATVEKTISDKAAKRNSNLAARAKQAKDKKAGIKNKSSGTPKKKTSSKSFSSRSKGRPGFEGGSGRKK
ncbi:hypothetical protein JCM5353_008235 [Sporobolomyces roseus]